MRESRPFSYYLLSLIFACFPWSPTIAETPEQVQQRLDQYRQHDEAAAQRKAEQDAQAARRRQQTLQWQEQRRREEYARRWKRYGNEEIDILNWRQQKDGTWVTEFKELEIVREPSCEPEDSFRCRLEKLDKQPVCEPIDSLHCRRLEGLFPPPLPPARVRIGDTLTKIASRYNLSITELLRLNPDLQAARLVAGTPIRTGLTWAAPSNRRSDQKFSSEHLIAVNCSSLMVNRKQSYENWGTWKRPARGDSDELLLISRCTTTQP